MDKLFYLKGYPEQIEYTIKAFAKYQNHPNNRKPIYDYLYPELLRIRENKKGIRKTEPTLESLIHNQAIPACYTLGLLSKDGRPKQTRLTPEGYILLKVLENEGRAAYLKKLGKILLDLDRKHNRIIETIENIRGKPGEFVSIVSLVIALHKIDIEACEKIKKPSPEEETLLKKYKIEYSTGSRLSDLLKYYQFSNIIIRQGDQIYLNTPVIPDIEREAILKNVDNISDEQFFNTLYEVYQSQAKGEKSGSYVPIWPYIRDYVCYKLNISYDDFVKKLSSLPTVINNKQIHLAHAGKGRPKWQLTEFGKDFYYYIAIFERGES